MAEDIEGPKGWVVTLKAWTDGPDDEWRYVCVGELKQLLAALERAEEVEKALPDDLRAKGWTVAVHNDYRQHGLHRTFWLLTNKESGSFLKGEGMTDAVALDQIRAALEGSDG